MKLKTVTSISVIALTALSLAAFGNPSNNVDAAAKQTAGAKLKSGKYKLQETGYSHGYKVKMGITVKKGKITKTTYDYVNKKGKSKTKDKAYEKQMKKVTKTGPKEYIPQLRKAFKKAGSNTGAIEVVSGATESSWSFKNYAAQLVQAAQAGNHKTIKIQNTKKMQDGTYSLAEKNYSHGYRVTFSITVKDGKITKSNYDNVDKNGKSKTQDKDYEKSMKKVNKVGPVEYTKELNEALVKKQTPAEVDVVSGATSSSTAFIQYAEQLINAAQAGNTDKITVDNIVYAE